MPSNTRSPLIYLPAILLLIGQVSARHSHHHHIRQIAVAVPIVATDPTPSTTIQATRVAGQASSEVISDIQDIKEGIDDLPSNLLSYIQSVDQRLETVESLLQSLLSGASPTAVAELPSAPVTLATSVRPGPAPFTAADVPAVPTGSHTSLISSTSRPTTYRTTRVTSTKTSGATVTRHMPIPVLSTGTSPRPFSYAPLGNGTLPAPTAGLSKSTGTKVLTLTVAVLPVPSTITLSGLTRGSTPTTFATLVRTL